MAENNAFDNIVYTEPVFCSKTTSAFNLLYGKISRSEEQLDKIPVNGGGEVIQSEHVFNGKNSNGDERMSTATFARVDKRPKPSPKPQHTKNQASLSVKPTNEKVPEFSDQINQKNVSPAAFLKVVDRSTRTLQQAASEQVMDPSMQAFILVDIYRNEEQERFGSQRMLEEDIRTLVRACCHMQHFVLLFGVHYLSRRSRTNDYENITGADLAVIIVHTKTLEDLKSGNGKIYGMSKKTIAILDNVSFDHAKDIPGFRNWFTFSRKHPNFQKLFRDKAEQILSRKMPDAYSYRYKHVPSDPVNGGYYLCVTFNDPVLLLFPPVQVCLGIQNEKGEDELLEGENQLPNKVEFSIKANVRGGQDATLYYHGLEIGQIALPYRDKKKSHMPDKFKDEPIYAVPRNVYNQMGTTKHKTQILQKETLPGVVGNGTQDYRQAPFTIQRNPTKELIPYSVGCRAKNQTAQEEKYRSVEEIGNIAKTAAWRGEKKKKSDGKSNLKSYFSGYWQPAGQRKAPQEEYI